MNSRKKRRPGDQDLSDQEKSDLMKLVKAEFASRPPRIGLVGVSGVGKSSTINKLFKTTLRTSHTQACTKQFAAVTLDLQTTQGPSAGVDGALVVIDAPGLGEDVRKDPEYLAMYREHLPTCDVILWIITARNRAIALDQGYLAQFEDLKDRMVFGLGQVDLVEPLNWKAQMPIPSEEQDRHIQEILRDRRERLSAVLGRSVPMLPYSNYMSYNLDALFTAILQQCASGRKWMLDALKSDQCGYRNFVPRDLLGDSAPFDSPRDSESNVVAVRREGLFEFLRRKIGGDGGDCGKPRLERIRKGK